MPEENAVEAYKLLGPEGDNSSAPPVTNGYMHHIGNHIEYDSPNDVEEYTAPQIGVIDQKPGYNYEADIKTNIPTRVGIDGTTTVMGGTFIVANAAIGCGTLAFSHAFKEAGGLYVGVCMVFVCAMLAALSLLICGYVCGLCRASDFHEIGKELLGWVAEASLQIFILIGNGAACVMYFIIIGDQLELILIRFLGGEEFCSQPWYVNRKMTICVITFVVVFPLLLVKRVDFLKYPSWLSVGSMVYLMFAIVIKYFLDDEEKRKNVELIYRPNNWYDAFNAFPTILFGYQCMVNAFPVHANLKDKTPKSWFLITSGTVFVCTAVYLPTAIFGYLSYGSNINSNILKSYDPEDTSIFIGQIGVMVSVMMTYPVLFYVTRTAFDPMYTKVRKNLDSGYDPMEWANARRIIESVTWYIGTLLLALFIPNIGVAINFAGSIAAFFYFIFPGAFLAKIGWARQEELGKHRMVIMMALGLVLVSFGGSLFIQGNYLAISNVMTEKDPEPHYCSRYEDVKTV